MQGKAIMVVGTASDVGKSLICTALCRIFANRGYRVAPFKSQNMALNSYVTKDGKEIGRAQGVQAEAARTIATTDMNPILLKPKQDMVAEIIVHGKRYADMDAREYRESYVEQAMPIVKEALERLQNEYDVLILEGAGSPAEINLKDRDIANLRMAHLADADVILVADIERGGVFASIIGTLELLDDEERARIKGFIINKFRGRRDLLDDGVEWLEKRTGIPVLAVLPYMAVEIEAEDSLALSSLRFKQPQLAEFPIDIAILRLPRISNFTDFDPLFDEPETGVRYVRNRHELGNPDLVIIPGTKNTLDDLAWLEQEGLVDALRQLHRSGTRLFGICGGFQMLGEKLLDPDGVEGDGTVQERAGLGFLPVETTFCQEKRTVQVTGELHPKAQEMLGLSSDKAGQQQEHTMEPTKDNQNSLTEVTGYEIHLGETFMTDHSGSPFIVLQDGKQDGAISKDGRASGTYLHGIFHNRHFTRQLINLLRQEKGLPIFTEEVVTEQMRREKAYDQLAHHVESHLNISHLEAWFQKKDTN
ncbi:cobyric acid synthase [Brevibacillus sp. SKDU10]|uniref:cobyric acid synthase n=1 Tax=Brevibacillus sp. SKDU10 TaxID=1247872 RepID=UPI0007C882E3|nr:cobyric acid synthase [Brevibacillus sp. SKDU10]OAJ74320.1 cobyric acid synthase [Brevibacillus sp. SKDU10]